jgi:ADP-ribose pyrophosphatase YjhB (NUDIX family)
MHNPSSHCSYCGFLFPKDILFPKTCPNCKNITYRNPIPVAITILPVDTGVMLVRRGIEPGKGMLALPGGFVDYGESWQSACAREVFEELGIKVNVDSIRNFQIHSSEDGRLILIFGIADVMSEINLPEFKRSEEAEERVICHLPVELAFPLHTKVLKEYFDSRRLL